MPLHISSTCTHHPEVKIVLQNLWYHHTEASEWSKITKITKITKIQFYKYEHIVVKFICEFFGCDYCVLLTINMLLHVDVMFNQLLNLLERCYVYLHFCLLSLSIYMRCTVSKISKKDILLCLEKIDMLHHKTFPFIV